MTNPDDLILRSDVTDVIDGWKSFRFSSRVMIDAINSIPAARSDKGEAVYQILKFGGWHDVTKERYDDFIGTKRIVFTAPQQAIPAGMPRLTDDELALLQRFKETTEDDSSHDLSPEEIQRLATFGVVRNHGGGYYSITEIGQWLSAAPTAPIDNGVDVNWLIEEVSAIDTRYRGDPSYDHDAYYFKQKVLDLLNTLITDTQASVKG
jgi:hypothetical protein